MSGTIGRGGQGDEPSQGGKQSAPSEESDFQDSFLKELVREESPLPVPLPGDRLGGLDGRRYEILEQIGSGGMGQVFRALDHELRRTVALKFLLFNLELTEPQRLTLLQGEGRAIARLDHENIVRVHDVSLWTAHPEQQEEGAPLKIPFLVMEHLEGETLHALMRRVKLGLLRALDILSDVAAGLAHAHARQLVHLDLKPGNVFICTTGKAKLLDFGLAQLLVGPATARESSGSGTPPYMSPEQWSQALPDARADVWGAGLLLFEMLTGEHPFARFSIPALRERITSAEPMPSLLERRPDLPEEVALLVASALSKDPAQRPASGAELLHQVNALREKLALRPQRSGSIAGRRRVTLLACRLTLTPSSVEPLDPEEFGELEAAFHRACTRLIRQHGGSITTAVGAEVLACFGYPQTREEDSEHAVQAALHLMEELPRELAGPRFPTVSVRTGIHADWVALEDTTPDFHGATPAMQGEAPRLASWLASQAAPETVLLSGGTHALVQGCFELQPLGSRSFETLSGTLPVNLHQVVRERSGVSRFDRTLVGGALTPLVGRELELQRLLELRKAVEDGNGNCVLLRGEPGIGKSRLVQELHGREAPGASTWALFQCWSQFEGSIFYPFIDWLQRFLEFSTDTSPQQKQLKLEQRLGALGLPAEHVPALASLLSLPLPEDSPFLLLLPDRQREQRRHALLALLQQLAVERPLILVVEDLHWADPSTLQFLDSLLRRHLSGARIHLLLTARPGFSHGWTKCPGFHELELTPLLPESTATLVREAAHGSPLPDATVRQIVARTDGIPLFVEEMTRMVVDPGAARGATSGKWLSTIPATLHELLLARLDQLSPRLKTLAQLAATLGREFSVAMLHAVSSLPADELERGLEQLEQARLIYRQRPPPDTTYAFKHALIQDAAYQSLLRSTRQRYHAHIVHVLNEQFPELVEERPEVLAHHATQAAMWARAVDAWQLAGQRAGAKSAIAESINHYTQALGQLLRMPASRQRDEREITLRVELGQALVSAKGYAAKEVEEVYARAQELCEQFGTPPLSVLWGIWVVALVRGDRESTDSLAARFLQLLEKSDDPTTLVVVHGALATWHFWKGTYAEAYEYCNLAKALITQEFFQGPQAQIRGGSQSYVAEQVLLGQQYLAYAEMMMGKARRAREDSARALALAEGTRHPYAIATTLSFCASIECEARAPEAVRDLSSRLIAISTEHGFPFTLAIGLCNAGWAAARLGEVQAGIASIRQGLGLLQAMGAMLVYPTCLLCLLEAQLLGGLGVEGLATVEEGLRMTETSTASRDLPEMLRLRGEFLLLQGEGAAARASLERALALAKDSGATLHELRAALSLARLMVRVGETEKAGVLLEEACGRFTEGSSLSDYESAQALLSQLRSQHEPQPTA
ncbi:protein kinase domain-containing protein [Hyalangium sp.]|uniref:protein kinase domain-containing protein n=1 Tax=Hyalangium sp. TaxID=2028555 RepID=UPI002D6AE320|nr:protein kinase [Hyalangium sp.]HYI03077.1 protein kinase [Hyalangium sp.]